MEIPQKRKRIFGGVLLLLMASLALATAVLAASGQWAESGSYSLVIQKQFATEVKTPQLDADGKPVLGPDGQPVMEEVEIPTTVLEEAMKKTYRFHIKGYYLKGTGDDKVPVEIDDIVEIGPDSETWKPDGSEPGVLRWKMSEKLCAPGPIYVTVTEITNEHTIEVGGIDYNMGDSRVETTVLFKESPQIRNLNSNGKISISRPGTKQDTSGNTVDVTTESAFRIRSEWPWKDDEVVKPGNWKAFDKTVTLVPGEDGHRWTGLSAGKYTIEDLSVSGYNIQLGERKQTVTAGETGTFYINSSPGRLVITAGGTAGDGGKHYYTVKQVGPNNLKDDEKFTERTTEAVESGAAYTLENLPRGEYEVTEYRVTDVPTAFKVVVPETEEKNVTKYLWSQNFTPNTAAKERLYYFEARGDHIDKFSFGPMQYRDKNGEWQRVPSTVTYTMYYGQYKGEDTNSYTYWSSKDKKAYTQYSSAKEFTPYQDKLWFGVWNIQNPQNAPAPERLQLQWTENTSFIKEYDAKKLADANRNYSFTVDERGWMEITAPTVDSGQPGANEITYTYELRKEEDGAAETLTLTPGETRRIEDLEAGSYLLMEKVNLDQPDGFTMKISGDPFGSNEAGKAFELTVKGNRQLTITKPQSTQDGGRTYTFEIVQTDVYPSKLVGTVTLKAGASNNSIVLPEGEYKVTPTDDMTEVFQLTCSDTSQVQAGVSANPGNNSATVTFTNVFTPGTLGYRYVHEYYLRDENGVYHYEGNSPITTVGGRNDANEFYGSLDVAKEPNFRFTGSDGKPQTYTYEYMPEKNAYGYVKETSWEGPGSSTDFHPLNEGTEKGSGKTLYYRSDDTLGSQKLIGVTEDERQILILRYFRVLEKNQKGSYKYVHVYYLRDAEGDHWEGTSAITTVPGQLGMKYSVKNVTLRPDYKPAGSEKTYRYVYENPPSYGTLTDDHDAPPIELNRVSDKNDPNHYHYWPNSGADGVPATEDGQNIIILRYYREVGSEETTGSYQIVHEYYYQEDVEDQGGVGDGSEEEPAAPEPEDSGPEAPPPVQDEGTGGAEDTPPVQDEGTEEPGNTPPAQDEGTGGAEDTPPVQDEGTGGAEDTPPVQDEGTEEPGDTAPVQEGNSNELPKVKAETGAAEDILRQGTGEPGENDPAQEPEANEPVENDPAQKPETNEPVENDPSQEPETNEPGENDPSQEPETNEPGENDPAQETDGIEELPEWEAEPSALETKEGESFSGTLSSDEGHTYTFEGARNIETISAPLGNVYKGTENDWKQSWQPVGDNKTYQYDYYDVVYGISDGKGGYSRRTNMEWASSTKEGNEIIILRYFRNEGTPGGDTPPDKPTPPPENPPPGGGTPPKDPTPPPVTPPPENPPPETPPETPPPEIPPETPQEPPTEPEYPTELPDPNDPNSPGEITIWEDGVPKTYVKVWDPEKEEWVYVPDEEVPLWNLVPETGDDSSTGLWMALAAASLLGLAVLVPASEKRRSK